MDRRPPTSTVPGIAAISTLGVPDLAGLGSVLRAIARARRRGARLIVFPEAMLGGYLHEQVDEGTVVCGTPSPLHDRDEVFARLIRAAGDAVVCIGYTEAARGGPYASAVCVGGDGVLGHQRKVHVPPGERGIYAAGNGFAAFDTPIGRLGMLVCYDKLFPEAARRLALDGAETIACLSAWAVCRHSPARLVRNDRQVRHFNAIDVARAVENQVVWVSANQFGSWGRLRFPGQSKVVDPDGRVLASTGARAGMALAEIDPREAVRATRAEISHLGDRFEDAYAFSPAELPAAGALSSDDVVSSLSQPLILPPVPFDGTDAAPAAA